MGTTFAMNTSNPGEAVDLVIASEAAAEESVYLALFKVTAIADLESPERAVEWAQSLLEDEQLRAAFVAGVESELAASRRSPRFPAAHSRVFRRVRDQPPLDPAMPLLRFG
jgi:hypothetical protein